MRKFLLIAVFVCASASAADPASQVSEVAARAVLGWMSSQGLTGVVQPRSMSRLTDALPAPLTLVPRPISADQVRPHMVVWVDVRVGERFLRSVPVSVDVALSQASAAATPVDEVAAAAAVISRVAALSDKPVAVSRGEWAALRTREGSVLLEGRVEVLQDGRPGERIRVRQQGATGIVLARVIARGELELAP